MCMLFYHKGPALIKFYTVLHFVTPPLNCWLFFYEIYLMLYENLLDGFFKNVYERI